MDLKELLTYIPASSCSYQEWVNVGMALKHEGESCDMWDSWSRADHRYHDGECARKWSSFTESGTEVVTGGTIYQMAVQNGYKPIDRDKTFDWDDVIGFDGESEQSDLIVKDLAWLDNSEIEQPIEWNPLDQFRTYIQTLFKPEDTINWVVASFQDSDKKYKPKGFGVTMKVSDALEKVSKWDKEKEHDREKNFRSVVGDYELQAGAWIRFNPLDGGGVKNSNVADYRYALVESDSMELGRQKALMEELQLPIAIMLHSGGKSIHAIVRIGAVTLNDYKQKVDYLYGVCEKNGLKIDTQNKNASRLSRMPGATRGSKKQFIIAQNIGCKTFDEWKDFIEGNTDTLPDIVDFADIIGNLPQLAPELIGGILRQGHKMLIAGASKAGKSFLLIELAVAIAKGTSWLGHRCTRGRVLYVNLEVADASFDHRVKEVLDKLKEAVEPGYLDVWNLRGENTAIDKLEPRLIRRAKNKKYSAIILDPLYKINQGDENSASEMAKFFNHLDTICKQLGASVILCHHHSKGAQGGKFAMDRASGSGVFARDPDAILDLIQINPADVGKSLEKGQTAWRVTYTLREFATPEPTDIIFAYPIHVVTDELAGAEPMSGADMDVRRRRSASTRADKKEDRKTRFVEFIANWEHFRTKDDNIYPHISDAVSYFKSERGFSETNIRRWASEDDAEFAIDEKGILTIPPFSEN